MVSFLESYPLAKSVNNLRKLLYSSYSLITYLREPYEFVHVLSHMRSGSSLLTHLLISNPEICGYGETHLAYLNRYDFKAVTGKVLYTQRRFSPPGPERYVLDKVLHDYLLTFENVDLLYEQNSRVIFLLREPHGTLASLMKTLNFTEEKAVDYYLTRLKTLESCALKLTQLQPCVVVTYEQILHKTNQVFQLFEQFLELQQPLSENYDILDTTGKYGVGDPSQNIRSGMILRQKKKDEGPSISDGALKKARDAFEHCQASLKQCCLSFESGITIPRSDVLTKRSHVHQMEIL